MRGSNFGGVKGCFGENEGGARFLQNCGPRLRTICWLVDAFAERIGNSAAIQPFIPQG